MVQCVYSIDFDEHPTEVPVAQPKQQSSLNSYCTGDEFCSSGDKKQRYQQTLKSVLLASVEIKFLKTSDILSKSSISKLQSTLWSTTTSNNKSLYKDVYSKGVIRLSQSVSVCENCHRIYQSLNQLRNLSDVPYVLNPLVPIFSTSIIMAEYQSTTKLKKPVVYGVDDRRLLAQHNPGVVRHLHPFV